MNKSELVEHIARRRGLDAGLVAEAVDGFLEIVSRSVARGEKVVLSGFGTFHRQARARRTARNIRTNQQVTVPARNVPAFRPGKPFAEAVGRRRARATPSASRAGTAGAGSRATTRTVPKSPRGTRPRPA